MVEIQGEEYLSAGEASELLGIKLPTLYAYVSRGVLRSYRQGIKRQRLYRRLDVLRILKLHRPHAATPVPGKHLVDRPAAKAAVGVVQEDSGPHSDFRASAGRRGTLTRERRSRAPKMNDRAASGGTNAT